MCREKQSGQNHRALDKQWEYSHSYCCIVEKSNNNHSLLSLIVLGLAGWFSFESIIWLQSDSIFGIIVTASILACLIPGLGRLKQLGARRDGIPWASISMWPFQVVSPTWQLRTVGLLTLGSRLQDKLQESKPGRTCYHLLWHSFAPSTLSSWSSISWGSHKGQHRFKRRGHGF